MGGRQTGGKMTCLPVESDGPQKQPRSPPAALPPRGLKPVAGSSQALMTDRTASSDDLTQLEMRDDLPAAGASMSL